MFARRRNVKRILKINCKYYLGISQDFPYFCTTLLLASFVDIFEHSICYLFGHQKPEKFLKRKPDKSVNVCASAWARLIHFAASQGLWCG